MNLRIPIVIVSGLLASGSLVGCGDSSDDPNNAGEDAGIGTDSGTDAAGPNAEGHETIQSALARETAPDATAEEMAALAAGNHALTVDLYAATAAPGSNYMVSTLSIRTAFAMVYAGSAGTTEQEMVDVLLFDDDQARFHNAMNALDLALISRNMPADEELRLDPIQISQANAFWGQSGYPWLDSYLDTLAVNYGAGIESLDFDTAPEESRQIINEWVEDRTNDRIQDLLPEGSITPGTAAVLTNAIYFKAPWMTPFEEFSTAEGDFTRADGSTSPAEFMNQLTSYPYAEGEGWAAVELPYREGELSMVVLVPDAGTFDAFDGSLSAETIEGAINALEPAMVQFALPKFEFETEFTLSQVLREMGMVDTFSTAADLSGMLEGGGLFVSEAFHKTFVAVDESGTEAAAATAVVIGETSVPSADYTLSADRPFYFLIRDRETDVWLFFGRVMEP